MTKRFVTLWITCLTLVSAWAQMPVTMPSVGDGRLRICGQNTLNYYVVDLTADRCDYNDEEGLKNKTAKMVQSFRWIDADIYALNELEVNDSVLHYLTIAMNDAAGEPIYSYIKDGLNADASYIKSGFVYRNDKVKPYQNSYAGTSQAYYKNTMRVQAWEELSTNERFVLSVNHFKAKDNTEDAGESKRMRNAQDLTYTLNNIKVDPDILVVGDLNCTVSEEPLQYLLTNASLTEQLLRFDSKAYSYNYRGAQQLIDHVLANKAMAAQITGAGVFHINNGTGRGSRYWYSDHDPYIVAMNLGAKQDDNPCDNMDELVDFTQGQGEFSTYTVSGSSYWGFDTKYGASISGYNKDGEQDIWLISPEYDLSHMHNASITLNHQIYYHNGDDYSRYQTLWVSTDYVEGTNPNTAHWTQVTIPTYQVKSYVTSQSPIADHLLGETFRYALRYQGSSSTTSNFWEVRTAQLRATCTGGTEIQNVTDEPYVTVRKYISHEHGLIIEINGVLYNAQGMRVQ